MEREDFHILEEARAAERLTCEDRPLDRWGEIGEKVQGLVEVPRDCRALSNHFQKNLVCLADQQIIANWLVNEIQMAI